MPFYDYKCNKCGKVTELVHGMSESREGMGCEVCGKGKLIRVFQAVGWLGGGGSHSHSGGHSCSSCSSGACGSCH
ncbi:MAG: zinc ribbon domain-containing protein [Candidatus Saganbacteria bacterium]|nr:zinc ribbon domain-containing protein [Candidatus Saganbacteria bacterium]